MTRGEYFMWIVYDHPRDMPDYFVARKFVCAEKGKDYEPTDIAIGFLDLDRLRLWMQQHGLAKLMRSDADPPHIIETWL